jgi:hypothetical protein
MPDTENQGSGPIGPVDQVTEEAMAKSGPIGPVNQESATSITPHKEHAAEAKA